MLTSQDETDRVTRQQKQFSSIVQKGREPCKIRAINILLANRTHTCHLCASDGYCNLHPLGSTSAGAATIWSCSRLLHKHDRDTSDMLHDNCSLDYVAHCLNSCVSEGANMSSWCVPCPCNTQCKHRNMPFCLTRTLACSEVLE